MSDKILPFHAIDQQIILSGPTFDKVADCLIELATRETKRGESTRWLDIITEIVEECPAFAYRLVREMDALKQQAATMIEDDMQILAPIRQVRDAVIADGRYEFSADKGELVFVRSNLQANTKKAKGTRFPITVKGLPKALEWLKLPTEEQEL